MMQVPLTGLGMETLFKLVEDAKDIVEISVYDYIPKATKERLKRLAQERGFNLFIVEPSVRIDIRTQADVEAEKDKPSWVGDE